MNEQELKERPITIETYCYTTHFKGRFYTLSVAPLVPFFVVNCNKVEFTADCGDQHFVCATDQPLYLIPYDCKQAALFGANHITAAVNLGTELHKMMIPMEFSGDVLQHMHFKLSDGKLFKPVGNVWTEVAVDKDGRYMV